MLFTITDVYDYSDKDTNKWIYNKWNDNWNYINAILFNEITTTASNETTSDSRYKR